MGAIAISAIGLGQGQQDFSKVQIKTNKVTDNFYTLEGQGGTIGVLPARTASSWLTLSSLR